MRFPAQLLNSCCPSGSESKTYQFTLILRQANSKMVEIVDLWEFESVHWLRVRKAEFPAISVPPPVWPALSPIAACGNTFFGAQQKHAFCCALLSCVQGEEGSAGLEDGEKKTYVKCMRFVQQAAAAGNHFRICSWSFWGKKNVSAVASSA